MYYVLPLMDNPQNQPWLLTQLQAQEDSLASPVHIMSHRLMGGMWKVRYYLRMFTLIRLRRVRLLGCLVLFEGVDLFALVVSALCYRPISQQSFYMR